jgi:putative spermidine/putrescine transport system substrate-binding protein
VAFDPAQFGDNAPATLADFFNTSQYPGKRGLRRSPKVNLEWALLADGVPADQVYDVLSTEEGLQRAFEKLDTIKRDIVWWEDGDAPARLLANEQVAMTSVFNGRIYAANENRDQDFGVIWDGQAWDYDMWAIPKRTPKTASLEAAMAFIKFAVATPQLAEQAKYISYGPARKSSMALLDEAIKPHLPTAPANTEGALRIDAEWWARNQDRMERQFEHWLARKEPFQLWRER